MPPVHDDTLEHCYSFSSRIQTIQALKFGLTLSILENILNFRFSKISIS